MICIFCSSTENLNTIEHIVPESLGNTLYTLQKGDICDSCNSRFSKFESTAMGASVIGMERNRLGIKTKKGKPTSSNLRANSTDIIVKGDSKYKKNTVNFSGKGNLEMKDFDPETGKFSLVIDSFNESQSVAVSKLLLKIGIESLFQSQGEVYDAYDLSEAKKYLLAQTNNTWPFITPKRRYNCSFIDILNEDVATREHLAQNRIVIRYMERADGSLLFRFDYGGFSAIINLLNRDMDWMELYVQQKLMYLDHIFPPSLYNRFKSKFKLYLTDNNTIGKNLKTGRF